MNIPYDSPKGLKDFLEQKGFAMSKRFGQNFLVDRTAREKLYASLKLAEPSRVWEIGPGIGSLTTLLAGNGHKVTAFEIDHGFARVMNEAFGSNGDFRLVEGDFLKTWKTEAVSVKPDLIFGNLPYSASLAIIADLLEHRWIPPSMVFTVQKEAAQRIAARPGTKEYSAFSVLCSSVCVPKILYDIGANAFWPRPNVTSSVIRLEPRPDPVAADDRAGFSRFVRGAFSSRRKTLRNNLVAQSPEKAARLGAILESLGLPAEIRAEALSAEQLAGIHARLESE